MTVKHINIINFLDILKKNAYSVLNMKQANNYLLIYFYFVGHDKSLYIVKHLNLIKLNDAYTYIRLECS